MTTAEQKTTPVSLRVSVIDRCQLSCLYCTPPEKSEKCFHTDLLTFDEIVRFINFLNSNYGLTKVHITGGEPLIRHKIHELIRRLVSESIRDVALTTNGQILVEMAHDLKLAGLKRINISLDSLNPDTFRRLTRGGDLYRSLAGIEKAIECGFNPVKINTVMLKNFNDHEAADIASFGIDHNCTVRFLELMPIGVSASHFHDWFVSSSEVMKRLTEKFELRKITGKSGSSARNYIAQDSKGRKGIIGFISPYSAPFCEDCRRLRLTSDGKLLGCLAREESYNIRSLLQDVNSQCEIILKEMVNSALNKKRNGRHFDTQREMVKIGG